MILQFKPILVILIYCNAGFGFTTAKYNTRGFKLAKHGSVHPSSSSEHDGGSENNGDDSDDGDDLNEEIEAKDFKQNNGVNKHDDVDYFEGKVPEAIVQPQTDPEIYMHLALARTRSFSRSKQLQRPAPLHDTNEIVQEVQEVQEVD